ncbi:MAG: UDP-2,3-diacylglucosamine diphosphatase LpxI [Alphaproteobacteria bacterium]|jgi:UDP-2,3-diacylglucosamine hydrolase|nr:UDP-2,3-diacylglucosamine diphosphatase LpxI [Alphaproteobacteria bacterium]MBT5389944.1 UDP-2,3-diacylglucosamine diphosphatase LpxI [Alphaproteobacteria bacterium]MBT5540040.1 UDP-2,3-diacylglucosamine diphosphatase LpxI [Alphaproteobacteria bacterium]MBT5654794.1 UDP-2,3-diacylglucosamine diphosphatase LpxI [Alphaproteobacteria bacterium]
MLPKLGLIAGNGELPRQVVECCQKKGRELFVIALEGQADSCLFDQYSVAHTWKRIGALGASLKALKEAAVEEVIMVGNVRRPSWKELRPDFFASKLLTTKGLKNFGDDALLKLVIREVEKKGFKVVGVQDVLKDILMPASTLGPSEPDAEALQDIERGVQILEALGQSDVGQAVVIQQGLVLGIEAIEGTQNLIKRCAEYKRAGPGGILVKLSKSGQENRVDLPTLGPDTIKQAAQSGLRGIAVEAGKTLIVNREQVEILLESQGLFLVGIDRKVVLR